MKKQKPLPQDSQKQNAIRLKYESDGVEGFYSQYAEMYVNPHLPYIKALIVQNETKLDYTKGLDFCAGNGEVSQIWKELGYKDFLGSDCFTFKNYEKNLEIPCCTYSFEDIVRQNFSFPHTFSTIVCSFAMHLCPEKQLFPLVYNLFQYTNCLVIITPHKRPQLENIPQIQLFLEDFVLTERGKKVFLKAYKMVF